ncbi:MAG: DUF2254 domain-containing protein, partial [Rhodobacterales bacterium]|nr:DUF2254 domain-containing protein [Rhodobacterales bacterium]
MLSLIKSRLREIRSALWFRPTAYSLAMLGLAVVLAVADGHLPEPMVRWLPDIGVPVVENLLRLLASSMLTVTTVTLSVLILVLSLAAGQASPRTVPELMADPPTQRALGTFLGSFVFSLSALVFLGVEAITGPGVALTFAVALLLVASALRHLVQWIHHVSDALKLNRVIERVHRQSHAVLDRYLDPATDSESDGDDDGTEPDGADRFPVHPHRAGYVQFIDAEALGRLAGRHDLRLRLAVGEGAFVQPR